METCRVLVVLGASGTGKSTASSVIAHRRQWTWMQVDDLRLALQYSSATIPHFNDELHHFVRHPDAMLRPVSEVVTAFIGTARAMLPAVRMVIDSHVVTNAPMVIEGDGILPDLIHDPVIQPSVETGLVRLCCIAPGTPEELLENMLARGRGIAAERTERAERHARANAAFGAWLVDESHRLGIPVVPSQPFPTLAQRIDVATS
jgi:2-phosphoglycerate kinase